MSFPPPPDSPRPTAEVPNQARPPPSTSALGWATAMTTGVLAASVASIPAWLRLVADSGVNVHPLCVGAVLTTLALLPMILSIHLFRAARIGLKAFEGEGASARAIAFSFFCALTFAGHVHLAMLLKATTHHRPLAGVAFSIGGLLMLVLAVGISFRAVTLMAAHPRSRWFFIALAVAAVALVLGRFVHTTAQPPVLTAGLRTAIIDGLGFVIVGLFASRTNLRPRRTLAFLGLSLAAIVIPLGWVTMRDVASLRATLHDHAPAFFQVSRGYTPW